MSCPQCEKQDCPKFWKHQIGIIGAFFVVALVFREAWNYIVPSLFGLKQIAYQEALALCFLLGVLKH